MALDGWKERLFRQYLYWICRPARLKRKLSALVKERRPAPPVEGRRLKAAALQVKIRLFKEPLDYAAEMHRRVAEAAAAGAQLVAFPEDNNLPLLGFLPGLEEVGETLSDGEPEAPPIAAGAPEITVAEVIRYAGPVMAPFLETLYSSLAASYGIYLMAGSFLLPDGERVVNRAFLYGPDGKLIGTQDKVHLMPIEVEWGISAGREFNLFETAAGKIAAPVCMDATFFETFRILELQGAEIVIIPIANPEPYNYWLALRGIWPRVQECPVYGIKSALVGKLLGFEFTGRAGIFAPAELTPGGSGVLAEVESPEEEGMAVAEMDLEALQELRRDHPWRDSNPVLYRRYFPHIYSVLEESPRFVEAAGD
ncbi:MAG: nitrilase-related carbon-nitrogen hydrolase [Dethiobacteria bacterium]